MHNGNLLRVLCLDFKLLCEGCVNSESFVSMNIASTMNFIVKKLNGDVILVFVAKNKIFYFIFEQ